MKLVLLIAQPIDEEGNNSDYIGLRDVFSDYESAKQYLLDEVGPVGLLGSGKPFCWEVRHTDGRVQKLSAFESKTHDYTIIETEMTSQ